MNYPVTPEERAALLRAYDEAEADAYNAELVEMVNAQAKEATRMPWWFWEAAVVVFVLTLLISVLYPWGVAS